MGYAVFMWDRAPFANANVVAGLVVYNHPWSSTVNPDCRRRGDSNLKVLKRSVLVNVTAASVVGRMRDSPHLRYWPASCPACHSATILTGHLSPALTALAAYWFNQSLKRRGAGILPDCAASKSVSWFMFETSRAFRPRRAARRRRPRSQIQDPTVIGDFVPVDWLLVVHGCQSFRHGCSSSA